MAKTTDPRVKEYLDGLLAMVMAKDDPKLHADLAKIREKKMRSYVIQEVEDVTDL